MTLAPLEEQPSCRTRRRSATVARALAGGQRAPLSLAPRCDDGHDGVIGHGFWRADVLYRVCDLGGGAGAGIGGARLRVDMGARALAHPDVAALAVAGRRRLAE